MSSRSDSTNTSDNHPGHAVVDMSDVPTFKDDSVNATTDQESTQATKTEDTYDNVNVGTEHESTHGIETGSTYTTEHESTNGIETGSTHATEKEGIHTTEHESTHPTKKEDTHTTTAALTNDDSDRPGRSTTPSHPDPNTSSTETTARTVYGPNDARGMSPRRSPEEIEQMADNLRAMIRRRAREQQAVLSEIAEAIELARRDNEKLERQNQALQEYIGGLTRSLAANDAAGKGKGKK